MAFAVLTATVSTLVGVVSPSFASATTIDITAGTSLNLLTQAFTTPAGSFCNALWVAYVPDTDGADFYDVQVNDTGGGSGPYETGFPYSNDVFFDGNVTWTAPSGFHQIPMA